MNVDLAVFQTTFEFLTIFCLIKSNQTIYFVNRFVVSSILKLITVYTNCKHNYRLCINNFAFKYDEILGYTLAHIRLASSKIHFYMSLYI